MIFDSYVDSIVRPLLTKPDALSIVNGKDDMGILLTLNVDKEDMGRIIGKSGASMNAIRLLVRQYGALHQARVSLKLNEPDNGTRPQKTDTLDKALNNIIK